MEESNFLLYTTPSGDVRLEIFVVDESIWLTQQKIANLFGVGKSTVSEHLNNVFETG